MLCPGSDLGGCDAGESTAPEPGQTALAGPHSDLVRVPLSQATLAREREKSLAELLNDLSQQMAGERTCPTAAHLRNAIPRTRGHQAALYFFRFSGAGRRQTGRLQRGRTLSSPLVTAKDAHGRRAAQKVTTHNPAVISNWDMQMTCCDGRLQRASHVQPRSGRHEVPRTAAHSSS
jgi:hypothetical protein